MVLGAACLLGLAGAEYLRPRKRVSLLGKRKLNDVIPNAFGQWKGVDSTNLVAPREENSLASKLYEQTVGRIYTHTDTGTQVMMLAAYGETQSRDLQLHRPEVCYPALGFSVSGSRSVALPLAPGVNLPIRQLVAQSGDRREWIAYWSRVGEYFPVTNGEQRLDVLRMAMGGYVMDGVLMRFSVVSGDEQQAFSSLNACITEMVRATAPEHRPALLGTATSKALIA
jgi:EpsI family protein